MSSNTIVTTIVLILIMIGVATTLLLTGSNTDNNPNALETVNTQVEKTNTTETHTIETMDTELLYRPRSLEELRSILSTTPAATPPYYVVAPDMLAQTSATIDVSVQTTVETAISEQKFYYTGTNVQVEGVDELDWVKTNGTHLFTVFRDPFSGASQYLAIMKIYPSEHVGIVLKVKVAEKHEQVQGIFLIDNGRTIVLIKHSYIEPAELGGTSISESPPMPPSRNLILPLTIVETYHIRDAGLEKIDSQSITGRLVGARLFGGSVALVLRLDPYIVWILPEPIPWINEAPASLDHILVSKGPVDTYTTIAVYNPKSQTLDYTSMLTPPVQRIYLSSKGSLYVFAQEWSAVERPLTIEVFMPYLPPDVKELIRSINETTSLPQPEKNALIQRIVEVTLASLPQDLRREAYLAYKQYIESVPLDKYVEHTIVYKAQISKDAITVLNTTTRLGGRLLDQFAIHETPEGILVVATTANVVTEYRMPPLEEYLASRWGIPPVMPIMSTVNNVYTLDTNLSLLGVLEGLAEGERIYSARYIGDYLFLVTFRRIDPLFAINLTDPSNPSVVGQLKIPGFSEYMHPVGDGLLLGVGIHTDDNGRPLGLKISLFNITNPLNPGLLDEIILENKPPTLWLSTPITWDHKAFTYDVRRNTTFIPVRSSEAAWVLVLSITDSKLIEKAKLVHDAHRTFVVEDVIVTVGLRSVKIWYQDTFTLVSTIKLA